MGDRDSRLRAWGLPVHEGKLRSVYDCGAPNEGFVVVTGKRVFLPKTIEEWE